jgi:hypothetical protein
VFFVIFVHFHFLLHISRAINESALKRLRQEAKEKEVEKKLKFLGGNRLKKKE